MLRELVYVATIFSQLMQDKFNCLRKFDHAPACMMYYEYNHDIAFIDIRVVRYESNPRR